MKRLFVSLLLIFSVLTGSAQYHKNESHAHDVSPGFRASVGIGHTYLPKDTREGKQMAILPSFGLDIEYWFSGRWGLGLHNDLELQAFEVKQNNELTIQRDYPVLVTLDGLFRAYKGLVVYAGPGVELEQNHHYFVTRLGFEYEVPIGKNWDFHPAFFHDMRRGAYDTYSLTLGIGKRF